MSIGSTFARDTSFIYRLAFNVYRQLPFLYELRSVIDWTFTSTALDLFQWFKMEDAYSNLYAVKAENSVRKDTHKLGEKRDFTEKCTFGCLFLLLLLVIILLPIFLFSNLNPAVELNNLTSASFSLNLKLVQVETSMSPPLRLFSKDVVEFRPISEVEFERLTDTFYGIDSLWEKRMQVLSFDESSDNDIEVSRSSLDEILKALKQNSTQLAFEFDWKFNRPKPEGKELVKSKSTILLDANSTAIMSNFF